MGVVYRLKGFHYERELARILYKQGFAVIRAPASGSRAKRVFYPDIVAIYKRSVLVFEVKARSELSDIYIDKYKVERLRDFAERSGGEAYVAVKITSLGEWRVVPISQLWVTEAGNYRVSKFTLERSARLEELVKKVKSDTHYSLR
jgi:Holliday junction resolvase